MIKKSRVSNMLDVRSQDYGFIICVLITVFYLFFPITLFTDSFPNCDQVAEISGHFGAIHQPEESRKHGDKRFYIRFHSAETVYPVMLWSESPLIGVSGAARVALVRYQSSTTHSYYYPARVSLPDGRKPLTCDGYNQFRHDREAQISNMLGWEWWLLLLICYCFYRSRRRVRPETSGKRRVGRPETPDKLWWGLLLLAVALVGYCVPSTILDTFPRCEQSRKVSGTLLPESRAAAGKLELLSDAGERVTFQRPAELRALPEASRWQIWVTPYHPDSLRESTYYPVRLKADEQQLLGCEEYHHFVSGVLDKQQQQLYLMLAGVLVALFSLWRILSRTTPTPPG